jgi:uncharacterized metal-binding protein
MTDNTQVCEAGPTLIFACSGAADVGAIADQAARRMTGDGKGKMFCLAGVGGRVDPIMETTQKAAKVLALDGCPLDCTRKCLEQAGFSDMIHLRVTDMGMEKGNSPATDEAVDKVIAETAKRL